MAGPLKAKSGALGYEGDIPSLQRLMRRLSADTTRPPAWRAAQMAHVRSLIDALNADLQERLVDAPNGDGKRSKKSADDDPSAP